MLEVQCDMAGAQCDIARSFGSLFGQFWRLCWSHVVLKPNAMAGAQYDVARSFGSLLGCFATFEVEPRRVEVQRDMAGSHMTWRTLLTAFWGFKFLLSFHVALVANATWRAQYDVACSLLPLGRVFGALRRSHIVLAVQRDMALTPIRRGGAPTLHRLFLPHAIKSHPGLGSEVAGLYAYLVSCLLNLSARPLSA